LLRLDRGILGAIGNTPLVRLRNITRNKGFEIFAKPEFLNPSGSIKDRIASRMIEQAEEQGSLRPGGTIIEASTGNTATALAMIGGYKGYKVLILIPERVASRDRVDIITKFGADIRRVPLNFGPSGQAQDASVHGGFYEIPGRIMARKTEDQPKIWWARQFSNPANVAAHREGTGREILKQMGRKGIDAIVASVGTGGTLVGLAEALREFSPLVVAVEPAGHPMLSRGLSKYPLIEGITDGFVYDILHKGLADKIVTVEDSTAIQMTHRLIREEGLFAGISSGANLYAAITIGDEMPGCRNIVTILPDSYSRYLTTEHYVT